MWALEIIKFRNEAYAAGMTATEVNFLSENTIAPRPFKIDDFSQSKIEAFKDIVQEKGEVE